MSSIMRDVFFFQLIIIFNWKFIYVTRNEKIETNGLVLYISLMERKQSGTDNVIDGIKRTQVKNIEFKVKLFEICLYELLKKKIQI